MPKVWPALKGAEAQRRDAEHVRRSQPQSLRTLRTFSARSPERRFSVSTAIPFKDRVSCGVDEAVAATGLGRTYLYELLDQGVIRSKKTGRRRLILVGSLLEFLEADNVAA